MADMTLPLSHQTDLTNPQKAYVSLKGSEANLSFTFCPSRPKLQVSASTQVNNVRRGSRLAYTRADIMASETGDHQDEKVSAINIANYALQIVSFGRVNGPLRVSAGVHHLPFSVRNIPNPPARLRKNHTGLSPRLRKEVMASTEAKARFDSMLAATEPAMDEVERRIKPNDARSHAMVQRDSKALLIVGITCDEGKHRSVSFAEELSKSVKRRDWDVSVHHRDLPMTLCHESDDEEAGGTLNAIPASTKIRNYRDVDRRGRQAKGQGFLQDEDG